MLFDKESTLVKADPRLRRIPFVVRRPTVSETKRVVKTLLTVYSFENDSTQQDDAQRRMEERAARELAQAERLRIAEEQRQAAKLELQRQEEINKAKNKEKKQRQKERRKLKNQQELAAKQAKEVEETEEDVEEQLKLLAAAVGNKAKKAPLKAKTDVLQSKARSSSKTEDLAARRQKLAEAAEKRAAALAAASSSQKFY